MSISTTTLFHFTSSIEILVKILNEGFWPRYCKEKDILNNVDKVAWFPMVCFSDLPLQQLTNSNLIRGKYGIGMTEKWRDSHEIAPVFYVNNKSMTFIKELLNKELVKKKNHNNNVRKILSMTKRYSSSHTENILYYNEREWRYVPNSPKIMKVLPKGDSVSDEDNNSMKMYSLKFNIEDISYIIIKEENERETMINQLKKIYINESESKLLSLISKIISFDQIKKDF